MCLFSNEMIPRDQRDRFRFHGNAAVIFGILLLWISSFLLPEIAYATAIYSYIDDRGTPVLTDNLESIPERYRAKVQVTEQAPKDASDHSAAVRLQQQIADWAHSPDAGLDTATPNIPGLSHYQSQVLIFGGIIAVLCLLGRFVVRSQVVRFLCLWCLVMLGLMVPALLFTSQDAPLDLIRDQSGKIQEKQQEHLKRAP